MFMIHLCLHTFVNSMLHYIIKHKTVYIASGICMYVSKEEKKGFSEILPIWQVSMH